MHRTVRLAAAAAPIALLTLFSAASCDGGGGEPCIPVEETDVEIDLSQANEIDGTGNADEIFAGDGPDVVDGRGGNDHIYGGQGADDLVGGDGDDTIHGGIGPDDILGDDGDDELHGGLGNDNIGGGIGNDIITGDAGNDELRGAADDDELYGMIGDDDLVGGIGRDYLDGGMDSDILTGGEDEDILIGGPGDDVLTGGLGEDQLYGGGDADRFVLELECGVRDVIFDFGPTEDEIVLPLDVFENDIDLVPTSDATGVVVVSSKPSANCQIAFIKGATVDQVANAIEEQ